MALGPRLDLRTAQTLVVSPQLQAAIRLLTLSNMELQAELEAELERNPLLDLSDDGTAEVATAEPASSDPGAMDETLAAEDGAHPASDLDMDLDAERFHHDCASDSGGSTTEEFSFDQVEAGAETLAEALERQAAGLDGFTHAIVLHLISAIDEAGYVTEPIAEIAERLGVSLGEVEAALAIVQRFEPTGVGARSLAECIALQAREADRYDPCMRVLIDNLDLVARGDLAQLRRLCDVDADDLADMLRELRSYNPKPGLIFGGGSAPSIVPDVFVRRTPKGWSIELNAGTLPRLVVNRQYQVRLQAHAAQMNGKGRAERQYVEGCLSQAHWLMKALDQRATTILKVATEIVARQEGFFTHGIRALRPLTLRAVADAVDLHESTVSRVTSNKYLSCERGVFELKYFFTTGIHSADGAADASSETVRVRIRALIDGEEPLKPLSDDKLVELLRLDGHDIARRTVTKYREAMGIPSSFDRRRRALVRAA
jgi:RNA polymerase sigma-54 factor